MFANTFIIAIFNIVFIQFVLYLIIMKLLISSYKMVDLIWYYCWTLPDQTEWYKIDMNLSKHNRMLYFWKYRSVAASSMANMSRSTVNSPSVPNMSNSYSNMPLLNQYYSSNVPLFTDFLNTGNSSILNYSSKRSYFAFKTNSHKFEK